MKHPLMSCRDKHVIAWKVFEIGDGILYTEDDVKKICPSSIGLIVHESLILPSKEEDIMSRKRQKMEVSYKNDIKMLMLILLWLLADLVLQQIHSCEFCIVEFSEGLNSHDCIFISVLYIVFCYTCQFLWWSATQYMFLGLG